LKGPPQHAKALTPVAGDLFLKRGPDARHVNAEEPARHVFQRQAQEVWIAAGGVRSCYTNEPQGLVKHRIALETLILA
jgi:hypothetical protein